MSDQAPMILNGDIARMDPRDAKIVLAELWQFLDEQRYLAAQKAKDQQLLSIATKATASQREQAAGRSAAFGVAARTYDIAISHAVLKVKMANGKRDREVLGEQAAERFGKNKT